MKYCISIECLFFWYLLKSEDRQYEKKHSVLIFILVHVFIIKLFKFVNNVVLKPLYTCMLLVMDMNYRWFGKSHKTYHVVQFCGLMFSTRNFAGKTLFEIGLDRYDLIKI